MVLGQKAYNCLLFLVDVSAFSLDIAIKEFLRVFQSNIPWGVHYSENAHPGKACPPTN